MNAIVVKEANLSLRGLFSPKTIMKKNRAASSRAAKTMGCEKEPGRRTGARPFDQSSLGGLLEPKSSSLSLAALAQAAAAAGRRLIVEIRDETPVKIVRISTSGV
jgi:hypothetical protein